MGRGVNKSAKVVLVVLYTSIVDGRTTACTEVMCFDDLGRQLIGRAHYGVTS